MDASGEPCNNCAFDTPYAIVGKLLILSSTPRDHTDDLNLIKENLEFFPTDVLNEINGVLTSKLKLLRLPN
jgi:hypothetical protein